ncbi:MAG TPA: protein phosphatase 2C domain-containing protein [Burkholderiales bacterium]|jgi:serine/threonine protein phosphatase PrpC|nr:protein phosphatase 2C domain-containing protein [Burkholderiales bacterium]
MPIRIEAGTGQHIGDRSEQQDRLIIIPSKKEPGVVLAVVADGMGGHTGGAMAAQQVVSTAQQIFENYSTKDETPQKLLTSIVHESHLIITLSSYTSEQEPHSTVVAMLLQKDRADWAFVGDSRLYHFRGQPLIQRTIDHSYVEQLFKEGKITAAEKETHPNKNILVHCLGGQNPPLIDFGSTDKLEPNDCFILCSDGLWAYFSDIELGAILSSCAPRIASEQLIALARERGAGHGDNVSLAIIKLSYFEDEKAKPPPPPPPKPKVTAPPPPKVVVAAPEPEPEPKKGLLGKLFGKK